MSDQTPERLQAFRDQNAPGKSRVRGAVVLFGGGVVIGIAGALAVFYMTAVVPPQAHRGLAPNRLRELALMYEGKDMRHAAIDAHIAYLDRAALSDAERGEVAYSIAKLAIDDHDYEHALEYLYEAELLAPESAVRDERSRQIVHCLEQLGRTSDLRRELTHRTNPNARDNAVEPGAVVLAEFGEEKITDRDLERKLAEMPESIRGAYTTPEKRTELLKNLVAERLLLDKAFRLKLDEDEELRAQMKAAHDSLLVRKLMENEVRDHIAITPEDVERFYKAERARFTEPATVRVLVANAETEEAAAAISEFNGQPISVRQGERLGGLPNSPEVFDTIFAAEADAITAPIPIKDRFFVFKVISKTPERVAPFEEVKAAAEQALRAEKEQEHVEQLIDETLKARNVNIYADRLEAKPSS